MFCHHCGSQIQDDATRCIHCGVATAPLRATPRPAAPGMLYCRHCGAQIVREAFVCVHCGVKVGGMLGPIEQSLFPAHGKSWLIALALCGCFGALGLHRFYVGKIGTGILQLVTFGGLGIWWLIDLILIAVGSFDDDRGQPLVR